MDWGERIGESFVYPKARNKKGAQHNILRYYKGKCPDVLESEGKVELETTNHFLKETPTWKLPATVLNPELPGQGENSANSQREIIQYCQDTWDLEASTLKEYRAWDIIFWSGKDLGLEPTIRLNYPAKLCIVLQGNKDPSWNRELSSIPDEKTRTE